MITRSASKINWYEKYATVTITTGTDDRGTYCMVVSERIAGLFYRVDIDNTGKATHCQCCSVKPCKHMRIAEEFLAPKITCEVEAGRWYIVNKNTQVWKDEESGKWFSAGPVANAIDVVNAHIAAQQAVTEAEQLVAAPQKPIYRMSDALYEKLSSFNEPPCKVEEKRGKGGCGSDEIETIEKWIPPASTPGQLMDNSSLKSEKHQGFSLLK